METSKICELANRSDPMPDCLQLHDSLLFQAMRTVYQRFHDGRIDLETAKAEKNKLLYQHSLWKQRSEDHLNSARRYQHMTIATEWARDDLRKAIRDNAPADEIKACASRLLGILDGVMPMRWKEGNNGLET